MLCPIRLNFYSRCNANYCHAIKITIVTGSRIQFISGTCYYYNKNFLFVLRLPRAVLASEPMLGIYSDATLLGIIDADSIILVQTLQSRFVCPTLFSKSPRYKCFFPLYKVFKLVLEARH